MTGLNAVPARWERYTPDVLANGRPLLILKRDHDHDCVCLHDPEWAWSEPTRGYPHHLVPAAQPYQGGVR